MKYRIEVDFDVDDLKWSEKRSGFIVDIKIPGIIYSCELLIHFYGKSKNVKEYIKKDIGNYIAKKMGYFTGK